MELYNALIITTNWTTNQNCLCAPAYLWLVD